MKKKLTRGGFRFLLLNNNTYAIVDGDDYKRLSKYIWSVSTLGYAENKKLKMLHHQVLKKVLGYDVDHRNGDKLDCRKANLRRVTRFQNSANKNNNIGVYKGDNTGKFFFSISRQGKKFTSKLYTSQHEARLAYEAKHKKIWGEYSPFNRPETINRNDFQKLINKACKNREILMKKCYSKRGKTGGMARASLVLDSNGQFYESQSDAARKNGVTAGAIQKAIKESRSCNGLFFYDKKKIDLAYERGEPLISDADYDAKFGLNSTGKILDEETPWEKFNHKTEMASLNKVPLEEFKSWVKKHKLQTCKFISSFKYDGMALVFYYKKGKLTNVVTRGDGSIGEDITRNALKMQNVREEIEDKNVKALIGEAIIPRKTYNKHLKNKYKNIRNAGAGIAKRFKGESECHHLSVRYYGLVTADEINSEEEKFEKLKALGFDNVFYKKCLDADDVEAFFTRASEDRENKNFEADGIVVTIDEVLVQNGMGRDPSGNPKFSVAVKYSNPTKQTKLKDIIWSMGKAGTITPVAKVEPVDLGVTVENISLANLDVINKLWNGEIPKRGDVLEVHRSGDVIPQILKVVKHSDGKILEIPTKCPTCSSTTIIEGPFLTCGNSVCDSRKLGDLYTWADKIKDHFKVKGLGPERIDQIFQAGLLHTVADLYTLQPEDLIGEISGVKEKSAENILAFQKHKEFPLPLFLSCLNIPSISESIFTLVTDAGHDTLEKVMKLKVEDLSKIGGLGEIRAKTIVDWLHKKEKLIEELLGFITIKKPVKNKLESVMLKGKSFCFTGKLSQSRGHYETIVKQNGGELKGISKSLDFLVVGENAGSKLAKANSLGVKILSEKQFMEQVKV